MRKLCNDEEMDEIGIEALGLNYESDESRAIGYSGGSGMRKLCNDEEMDEIGIEALGLNYESDESRAVCFAANPPSVHVRALSRLAFSIRRKSKQNETNPQSSNPTFNLSSPKVASFFLSTIRCVDLDAPCLDLLQLA
ncbi:hypothetical protein Bca4012_025900 [Brassica carinata]